MNLTMFERLQLLPLFQGLSFSELSEIVEWMKMDFCQFHANDIIVSQDDKCSSVIFIISGEVCAEYVDADRRFILYETLPSSLVLEPYNIHGMYQRYTRSYIMESDGGGLVIPKNVFNELLRRYQVIRTNYINMICTKLQKVHRELCGVRKLTVRQKILKLFRDVSCTNKGRKRIKVKMETLAEIIDETRLNVSRELNNMKKERLITMKRGEIEFLELFGI